MPVPLLAEGFGRGITNIPYIFTVVKLFPILGFVYLLKVYFSGTRCTSERVMHGKVILVTGGTSGIGAAAVRDLATRGAQIILLTHHAPSDPFLVEYIDDLRTNCSNELIYAEQVDFSSLHSIRSFATKWVDNAPPRRLDMIVVCAATMTPLWGESKVTSDGLEEEWMINYVSVFHLMSILSPALRAQPPDRDVRVLLSTCNSYIWANFDLNGTEVKTKSGSHSHARSKLALMNFAVAFQKHLDAYNRPDKHVNNARVFMVDPGFCRTPGTRRWISGGSLLGLLAYVITWPVWWLTFKSSEQGAQSLLYVAMDAAFGRGAGGKLIKECRELDFVRLEVKDEKAAKSLWEFTDKQIERLEKQGAVNRALEKKNHEAAFKTASQTPPGDGTASHLEARASGGQKLQVSGSRRNRKG